MMQTPIQAAYQNRMESMAREYRMARMKETDSQIGRARKMSVSDTVPTVLLILLILFMLGGGCQ